MIAVAVLLAMATPDNNLGLTDPDFFRESWADWEVPREGPDGLELAAPRHVDLAAHKKIPVVVRKAGPARLLAMHVSVGFVALEIGGDGAWQASEWRQVGDEEPPRPPSPERLQAFSEGMRSTSASVVDLREQLLEFTPRPMTLRVWAIAADRISNPRDVVLSGPAERSDRPPRAPEEPRPAARGKSPVEPAGKDLIITPRAAGMVHVAVVDGMGFLSLYSFRAAGAFHMPRLDAEHWIYVFENGQAVGPVRVATRKPHAQKMKKR